MALAFVAATVGAADAPGPKPARLTLRRGDHVSIIGNALAEGLQHDGWWETLLHQRFPEHELVVRNLAFAGDEIVTRPRSEGFGTPDENLAVLRTDVVLAFFGWNESFAGPSGLDRFRAELDAFVKHTRAQRYDGSRAPELVLFSPIAHEDLHDPNLPDGRESNARLAIYTRAMAEVARDNGVPFVDLLHPTTTLYDQARRPLTLNGVHLTDEGYRQLSLVIDSALFGPPPAGRVLERLAPLRAAVLDKSETWFHRHRATDGYNIYGGRSHVKYVDGQTNRVVMDREMQVLDVMAANRDRRIWAVARGRGLQVDDANAPPFVPVETNYAGSGPNGQHVFLDAEAAIARMTVGRGMKVNLFASEERFPDLAKPVQMSFDAKGRLWVAAWPSYPHWKPKDPMNDKLLILEDTDGDGRADRSKVFADGLHDPTGFEFWNGGVLVAQAPDLVFLADTNGDDRADVRVPILHGLASADTHHMAHTFVFDPGGALYFQDGWYGRIALETPWAAPARMAEAGIMRFEPRTWKAEVFATYDCANPHGHVFDRWGQDIFTDGTSGQTFFTAPLTGRMPYSRQHRAAPLMFTPRTRPVAAIEILSSRHFPDANQGNLLLANVIGFRGILQYRITDDGAGMSASEVEPLVSSSDPNFRPVDVRVAPDGSIYFLDWQNPLIDHLQHAIRDPSRDHTHGRIYRITYPARPLRAPAQIEGAAIDRLVTLLEDPDDRVRYRTRIELGARKTAEVMAATARWIAGLDARAGDHEHELLEALWLHEQHNVVDGALLLRLLRSRDFRARAAATRVLRHWRDRVPEVRAMLRALANDPHPRVRLEAVVAATSFDDLGAVEIALDVLTYPRDEYVDYALADAVATLAPTWKKALREGSLRLSQTGPGLGYLLARLAPHELLELPRSPAVHAALLVHDGISDDVRHAAARALGGEVGVLLGAAERAASPATTLALGRLLLARPAAELRPARGRLAALARDGSTPEARQIGYAAWVAADGSARRAFATASRTQAGLRHFLDAVPLVADRRMRAALFARIRPLLPARAALGTRSADTADSRALLRRATLRALSAIPDHDRDKLDLLVATASREGAGSAERGDALDALGSIDRAHFRPGDARATVGVVITHVSALRSRSTDSAIAAVRLARDLAALLPLAEGDRVRAQLKSFEPQVVVIRPIPHQMLFDRRKFVVEAGRTVEISFENSDVMPHNLVITVPDSLAEVGRLADQMGADGQGKDFLPETKKILWATKLLLPGQSQRLQFTAPKRIGSYPYLCTFPGHWLVMNGIMEVVETATPAASLVAASEAAPPAPPAARSFVRMWTLADLERDVAAIPHGRSFSRGRQIFADAGCVKCHTINGEGGKVGPDLTRVADRYRGRELLRQILEPSAVINDKFRTYVVTVKNADPVAGIIVAETERELRLVTNLQDPADVTVIPKERIVARQASDASSMPTGLLVTLNRDEILDLLAYVEAGGDARHAYFRDPRSALNGRAP